MIIQNLKDKTQCDTTVAEIFIKEPLSKTYEFLAMHPITLSDSIHFSSSN